MGIVLSGVESGAMRLKAEKARRWSGGLLI